MNASEGWWETFGRCAQCGLSEPWDGILCSHCAYRASDDELERSIEHLHAELSSRLASGHLDGSRDLAIRLLDLVRARDGDEFLWYAGKLHQLADLRWERGEYDLAEARYRRAINLYDALFGAPTSPDDHPRRLHLAACDVALHLEDDPACDDVDTAFLWGKSLGVLRLARGEDFPYYAVSQCHLACVLAALGRSQEAWEMMRLAVASDDFMIRQVCAVGNEQQRGGFLRRVQKNVHLALSLVLRQFASGAGAVGEALALVFRRKVLAADVLAAQRAFARLGTDPAVRGLVREVNDLRLRVAGKVLSGPGADEALSAHLEQLGEWKDQLSRAEARLARATAQGGTRLDDIYATPSPEDVRRALPGDAALVEFVRLPLFDFQAVPAAGQPSWGEPRYVAFVLPGRGPGPCLIDLGPASVVEALLDAFLRGVLRPAETRNLCRLEAVPPAISDHGERLREALVDPLLAALGGGRRLVIAPDGDLCRLPFEVLPAPGGGHLLDSWRISYLACGRDALRREGRRQRPSPPLVVTAPNFDLGRNGRQLPPPIRSALRDALIRGPFRCAEAVVGDEPDFDLPAAARTRPPRAPEAAEPAPRRGFLGWRFGRRAAPTPAPAPATHPPAPTAPLYRDPLGGRFYFVPLPGTRLEGERVAALLGGELWSGDAALKASLWARPSPRVLHLATHGFLLGGETEDEIRPEHSFTPASYPWAEHAADRLLRLKTLPNPMLRAGLVLSGVNAWLQGVAGHAGAGDGLLTAEEVTTLELGGTELVVLSACDSGLGTIRAGEGVLGLGRAFQVAGARTLVLSLWKVDDLATAVLMERFYERLLAGDDRDEALREARRHVREATVATLKERWLAPAVLGQLAEGDEALHQHLHQLAAMPDGHRPFAHPFYWGAFVCQGDTAPLPEAGGGAAPPGV
jgi:hypothetical protein